MTLPPGHTPPPSGAEPTPWPIQEGQPAPAQSPWPVSEFPAETVVRAPAQPTEHEVPRGYGQPPVAQQQPVAQQPAEWPAAGSPAAQSPTPPFAYQQPATAPQQPPAYQQHAYQQPQQPAAYQQQPAAQQPAASQQPAAYQQPHAYQQPAAHQAPSYQPSHDPYATPHQHQAAAAFTQSPLAPSPLNPGQPHEAPPTAPNPGPNPGAKIGWLGAGLALVLGFLGIVLGAISISRSKKAGASRTPGIVAVVVGVLQVIAVVTTVLVMLFQGVFGPIVTQDNPGDTDSEQSVNVVDLAEGNCLADFTSGPTQQHVPCSTEHAAEVVHTYTPDGDAYPGADAISDEAAEICLAKISSALPPTTDPTGLYFDWWFPESSDWDNGDRTVACLLTADGVTLTGSVIARDLTIN